MSAGHLEADTLQIGIASLRSIDVLKSRPGRTRGPLSEIMAYERLHETLLKTPARLLEDLAETAVEFFGVETAGVSLLERTTAEGDVFRWCAIAGRYAHALNMTMPRHMSPCGHVVGRNSPLLFRRPLADFPILQGMDPPVEEA